MQSPMVNARAEPQCSHGRIRAHSSIGYWPAHNLSTGAYLGRGRLIGDQPQAELPTYGSIGHRNRITMSDVNSVTESPSTMTGLP